MNCIGSVSPTNNQPTCNPRMSAVEKNQKQRERLMLVSRISQLLDTGLDNKSLFICVRLIEAGEYHIALLAQSCKYKLTFVTFSLHHICSMSHFNCVLFSARHLFSVCCSSACKISRAVVSYYITLFSGVHPESLADIVKELRKTSVAYGEKASARG